MRRRIFRRLSLEKQLLKVLQVHVIVFKTAKNIRHSLMIYNVSDIFFTQLKIALLVFPVYDIIFFIFVYFSKSLFKIFLVN